MSHNLRIYLLLATVVVLSACAPSGSSFTSSSSSPTGDAVQSTPVAATPAPTTAPTPSPNTAGTPLGSSPAPSPQPAPAPTPVATPARPSTAKNESICSGSSSVSGVDVSAYDSGTIWSTVQHSGEGYTFIKATEGITYISPDFTSDWAASQKAGLLRGAYHFFHPGDNPTEAAAVFLKTMGTLQASDLPAVLDWEVTDGVSNAVQIQNALIWLNQVETATGKVPIIYVAPAFWNALGNPTSFARYPLYIANYSVTCPTIPPPWSDWVFWQKSESGKVSGVQNTAVDLDVFNGNPQQLTQFAKTGSL